MLSWLQRCSGFMTEQAQAISGDVDGCINHVQGTLALSLHRLPRRHQHQCGSCGGTARRRQPTKDAALSGQHPLQMALVGCVGVMQ